MSREPYNPVRTLVDINFDGDIKCKYCPILETYSRNLCRRTGEYITDTNFTGRFCPLIIHSSDEFLKTLIRQGDIYNETV